MARDDREDDDDLPHPTAFVGDWDEWGRYVLAELRSARAARREMQGKLDGLIASVGRMRTSFAVLEVKSGFWGVLGGMIAGAAGVLYAIFHKGN